MHCRGRCGLVRRIPGLVGEHVVGEAVELPQGRFVVAVVDVVEHGYVIVVAGASCEAVPEVGGDGGLLVVGQGPVVVVEAGLLALGPAQNAAVAVGDAAAVAVIGDVDMALLRLVKPVVAARK